MHILAGLLLFIGLLYFWLLGHWFARVLVFLVLIPVLGLVWLVLISGSGPGPSSGGAVFLAAIGGGVSGWFVSGLPLYYWRHRFAQLQTAQQFKRLP